MALRSDLSSIRPSDPRFGSMMLFPAQPVERTQAPRRPRRPAPRDRRPKARRQLAAIASLSHALVRATSPEAAARTLIETCFSLLSVDFAAVAPSTRRGGTARGCSRLRPTATSAWWRDVESTSTDEPSAIASAVFEGGAGRRLRRVGSPTRVNPRLAERVGAKSAVFVPLISEEKVPAVLVLATTERAAGLHERRACRCSRRSRPRRHSGSTGRARRTSWPTRSSANVS